ncbi:MAG: ribonuclease HII [Candidatus Micrarchaeota archaeon]|nr:ribonuclease HII [Candidatus Micrarchaeota archaeon]
MIVGVDEAGRGCIIGPMVICAAAINPLEEYRLKELGVKDSKRLTPRQRERLYGKVGRLTRYTTVKITAEEINLLMEKHNLNEIEAMKIAHALDTLGIKNATVYVDSPDNVPQKFAKRIERYLKTKLKLVCTNKADDKYVIVGAASIIAKVTRDREIERIKKEVGVDFNSGYTSDPFTQQIIAKRRQYPLLEKYIRKKWATLAAEKQSRLLDFCFSNPTEPERQSER